MSKNPFRALGFAPEAFRGLNEQEIMSLVKAQHRALSQIHHPDRGGKSGKFQEMHEAFDQIDLDREGNRFQYWIKVFRRPNVNKAEEAERETETVQANVRMLEEHLQEFWKVHALQFSVRQITMDVMGMDVIHDQISVLHPPRARMIVHNKMERALFQKFQDYPYDCQLKNEMLDVELKPDGTLRVFPLNKIEFDARNTKAPKLPKGWVNKSEEQPWRSYYWKREEGKGETLEEFRLIGSIDEEKFSRAGPDLKSFLPLLTADDSVQDYKMAREDGFTWDQFAPYIQYMKPVAGIGDILVGACEKDGELKFKIIGAIRKFQISKRK